MISHLGINGIRAQPNGPIEKGKEGNVLHTWKEKEKLSVIFENEYFIHKNEDNFLGVLLIPPPKNKEVLARNLSLGQHNKIKRGGTFGVDLQ